jgi:diguanylate cyclase (GGDEF)-like protein
MSESLLATSDDEWRIGLRALLAPSGERVHEAATWEGLRGVLARVNPDLVVLDHALVGALKLPWLSEFRALAPHASLVLLVDARFDPGAESPLYRSGVIEIVRKPISPSNIDVLLSRLVAPPSQSGSSSSIEPLAPNVRLSARQKLEELQRGYRARLASRLGELELALSSARAAGPGTAEFHAAHNLAHRLRGSAGTFGLHGVAACAAAIDDELTRLETPEGDTSGAWSSIFRALARSATDLDPAAPCIRPSRSLCPGLSLLVLDDDPDCRQLVSLLGRAASLNVIESASTAEAVCIAAREPIDVVLVDLHLGGNDDAASAVAELRRRTHDALPIAAFSADTGVQNRLAAIRAGTDAFLAKPLAGDELALTVRRLLEACTEEPHRILVVDDDPTCSTALTRWLRQQGWHATSLCNTDQIFDVLDSTRPDLLLLDVMMPVNGLDICRVLRASPIWRELAIVFVTAATDPETLVRCYEVGGDDCISKSAAPRELHARLSLRLDRARVFRQLAHEDALTGLVTREAFSTSVARRVAEALRHSRPLSIVMLDLDRFKHTNDQHGHLAGDRVLRSLGNLLKRRFRVEDVRGRWGGEEFVMALSDTEADSAALALQRALEEFRGLVFEGDAGKLFCCSFSAGIAQLPNDGSSLSALMQCADSRLYAAKAAGRSRIMSNPPPAGLLCPVTPRQLEVSSMARVSGTYATSRINLIGARNAAAREP